MTGIVSFVALLVGISVHHSSVLAQGYPPPRNYTVGLYLFEGCNLGYFQGVRNITADGQCNEMAGGRFDAFMEPGPYYRAISDQNGNTVQFLNAECRDPECTICRRGSRWTSGANGGIFNMTVSGCQEMFSSSFRSNGRGVLIQDPEQIVPVNFLDGAANSTSDEVPSRECAWDLSYYDGSDYSRLVSGCVFEPWLTPVATATIIPDGICRDSAADSIGYYQAVCDPDGGLIFLTNKCSDSTCLTCDADSDIYTGTVYTAKECYNHDSETFRAWTVDGSCTRRCDAPPTTPPPRTSLRLGRNSLP